MKLRPKVVDTSKAAGLATKGSPAAGETDGKLVDGKPVEGTPVDGKPAIDGAGASPRRAAADDAFLALGRAAPPPLVSSPAKMLSRLYDLVSGAKPVPMAEMPGVRKSEANAPAPSPDEAYAARCAALAEQFPSLAFYLKDMRGYAAQKAAEFQDVRKTHPDDPHDHLEFFEAAKPFIDDALPTLSTRKQAYTEELIDLRMRGEGHAPYAKDLELGITFLDELKGRMEGILDKGSLSYMKTQALAHHYTCAMDVNQHKDFSLTEKMHFALDASWQGYERAPLREDYEAFKADVFTMFEGKASSVKTIKAASGRYRDAFFDKEELRVIRLPTQANIDQGILLDSMTDHVELVGTVPSLLHADGVARPPKAFELHDDRHSSLIHMSVADYMEANGLTGPTETAAQDMAARFKQELLDGLEVLKQSDPQLAGAVYFFFFNYHHERARMIMPSSYKEAGAYTHHAYGKFVLKKRAGEKMEFEAGFLEGFKLMGLAQQYVREFMLTSQDGKPPRIAEEDKLTAFAARNGGPRDYAALEAQVLAERPVW